MMFSCDIEKPTRTDCRELYSYYPPPYTSTLPPPPRPTENEHTDTPPKIDWTFLTSTPESLTETPPEVPGLIGGTQHFCPEVCPRGPPGLRGAPGPPGHSVCIFAANIFQLLIDYFYSGD